MTRTPRTDLERQTIIQQTSELATHYNTIPHLIHELRAAIDETVDDGLKGTRYDGVGGGGDGSSGTERVALGPHLMVGCPQDETCRCPDVIGDRASNDRAELDRALRLWAEGNAIVSRLRRDYGAEMVIRAKRPGVDPCPSGRCANHWNAGISTANAKKRYTDRCRKCGDYLRDHGFDIPPRVLVAVAEAGGDWSSWRVKRAWEAA